MPASRNVSPAAHLHNAVLDSLGERIAGGQLAPRTVLTLETITGEYDVSLSVTREAIRVLESMGMVASRRRVGVTVQARDNWNVFDPRLIRWRLNGPDRDTQLQQLSELRRGFEPAAAALAALRATPQHCGTMSRAVTDMVVHGHSGDLERYLEADIVFHCTMLEASGNEMMASLGQVVTEVLAGRTHHHLMPARPNPAAIDLHDAVARAVRMGDAATAETAMRNIIDEAAQAMRNEQPRRLP